MRVVVDTNLRVWGVISAGLPRRLVDSAKAGEFDLCTSEVLLAELLDVFLREKFAARLAQRLRVFRARPSCARRGVRSRRKAQP